MFSTHPQLLVAQTLFGTKRRRLLFAVHGAATFPQRRSPICEGSGRNAHSEGSEVSNGDSISPTPRAELSVISPSNDDASATQRPCTLLL